ncbi:MAG: paraquat-inducible protein A [bacterium]|nr:paraquat-inducible protein A [bacterium]
MSAPLKACHCCGLVQHMPALQMDRMARCGRCGVVILHPRRRADSNGRSASAALAALILYPLAITLPIMHLERFGHKTEASIWSGTLGLLEDGDLAIGMIVLVCSIVIPILKLAGLLAITVGRTYLSRRRKALTYRLIEWTGRWGMLDVLLIAVIVAWVKVGDLVDVRPGPAAWTFATVVVLSLFASAWFDPHAVWELEEPQRGGRA